MVERKPSTYSCRRHHRSTTHPPLPTIVVTVFKCLHDLAPSFLVELLTIHQRYSRLCQTSRPTYSSALSVCSKEKCRAASI